jgi:hypothetical protein
MYRFRGLFSSVEDFIENGDWNSMEELEYNPLTGAGEVISNCFCWSFMTIPRDTAIRS